MLAFLKKAYISWPLALVLAITASVFVVVVLGHASYDVDGLRLGFTLNPALRGETELAVPPFGELTAATHKTPVQLIITVERIYPNEISQVANNITDSKQLVAKVEMEGKRAFRQFVIRILVLAVLGGILGALILPGWRIWKAVAGMFIGAICIGAMLAGTYYSFNVDAFKQPRYSGALSAAPWVTDEVAKRLGDIKAFRNEVQDIVRNVDGFYAKMDAWQPLQGNAIKVLHVSDIHNNPLAIDLIKHVVRDFNVDFVIDTGDITDFGTPVETKLIQGISKLPVPYVFVSGNHDSTQTIAFMKQIKNVVLAGDTPVTVKGITIMGEPDPHGTLAPYRDRLAKLLATMPKKPLILAVHNPAMAEDLIGTVPVILVGHTHKPELVERNGNVLSNAGTTGAAGLRSFQQDNSLPYTLDLLHIDRTSKRLIAIDSLTMMGTEQEFRLERHLIKGKKVRKAELSTSGRR